MTCAAFGLFEDGVDFLDKEAVVDTLLGKLGLSQDEERQYAEQFHRHSGYYLTHNVTAVPPASPPAPWRSGCDPFPALCSACHPPLHSRPASVCTPASSAGI